jgi:hypothetical protein
VESSRFSATHLQQLTGGNIIHRFYILNWQGRTPARCTLSEGVLHEATVALIRPNTEDIAHKYGTGSHPADVICGDISSVCGGYGWLLTYRC